MRGKGRRGEGEPWGKVQTCLPQHFSGAINNCAHAMQVSNPTGLLCTPCCRPPSQSHTCIVPRPVRRVGASANERGTGEHKGALARQRLDRRGGGARLAQSVELQGRGGGGGQNEGTKSS